MRAAKNEQRSRSHDQQGMIIVMLAVLLLVFFLALGALGIDISHIYAVKHELKSAADAGALAGAQRLYNNSGTSINPEANQVARFIAMSNKAENSAVEVDLSNPLPDPPDVQRGHWKFPTANTSEKGIFTPNDSLVPPNLWNKTSTELNNDTTFINAVRVKTKRKVTKVNSFFAKILGFNDFTLSAESVAYIGFAGKLEPHEVDQPIAICLQSITDAQGNYTCNVGRMTNSGGNAASHNTAAWTNFSQPCTTANQPTVSPYICGTGNSLALAFGIGVGSTGGTDASVLSAMRACFGPTTRTEPWAMTLPVIDCPGNNPSNCAITKGAVTIDVVWMSISAIDTSKKNDTATENKFRAEDFPPSRMGDWTPVPGYTRTQNWDDFVAHFKLKNVDNITATYDAKSIYFIPSCTPHELTGNTGGANFGILAKNPVLVN